MGHLNAATAPGPRGDVQRIYEIRRRLTTHWAQTGTLPGDFSALLGDGPMGADFNSDAMGGRYAYVISPDSNSVRVTSSGRGGYSIVGELRLKDRSGHSAAEIAPWSNDPLNDVCLPGDYGFGGTVSKPHMPFRRFRLHPFLIRASDFDFGIFPHSVLSPHS